MDEFMAKPCTKAKLVGALERIEMVGKGRVQGYSEESFRPFVDV